MKIKFLLCTAFIFFAARTIAQNPDEEAIKNAVRMETEATMKKDSAALKNLYVHDDKVSWLYAGTGFYSHFVGWDKTWPEYAASFKKYPDPVKYNQFKTSDYIIRIDNNTATVNYNQQISYVQDNDSAYPYYTREFRTMIKDNGQWKITSLESVDTSLGSTSPQSIEDKLNALGYVYLNDKKIKDAIEIFKLNVRLFPNSWNVYDSLGDGYAGDNDTDDAVKNYEISIKINPKNEEGKQKLEKLKKK